MDDRVVRDEIGDDYFVPRGLVVTAADVFYA